MGVRVGYSCQLVKDPSFGVSNYVLQLARALLATAEGRAVVFYVRDERDELRGGLQRRSPALTRRRLGRILWEQLALPRLARADGLDVLHAPAYVSPLASRVPVVVTVHDVLAFSHPAFCTRANRAHFRLVMPHSLRRASRVVACSQAVRAHILERFVLAGERVVVIPPGVDERFRVEPDPRAVVALRTRYGLDAPFVLFAGNHEPKKNLARLVDAFRLARECGALDGELVLTGSGASTALGDVLRGREQAPGVRFLPYLPAGELPLLYRAARLLAFPSLAEGFGLPVLEAMASGLPVLCADVPALADSDPRAAVVVEPTSTDSLAGGLGRLWQDEELRALLARRGLEASAPFTWTRTAQRLWALYAEVAGEAPG